MVSLRRIRSAALTALRQVDHTIGRRSGRVRVLVDVRTPMNLAVLRPVWAHLALDPRVTLAFSAEDAAGVRAALSRHGLADALIPRRSAAWTRFDLALTADAWNHAALYRCRRRLNFFHGIAGKYGLDAPSRLAGLALEQFDRIAFINKDRMQRYLSSGVVRPDQAVLVGFPKLDALLNGEWSAAGVRVALGLEPGRHTVLYAPTFSTASSLHAAGERIIEALLDGGRNVIVKLHDRSMSPHPRFTGGIDWPARLARFESDPRFAFAHGEDSGPFLAAADVLVTDHSTVGFEFALLDRPIVVYDVPELEQAARIDPGKWGLLRAMSAVVATPAALVAAVDDALTHPARRRDARRQCRDLFAHPGTATGHALRLAYELLDLPTPEVMPPPTEPAPNTRLAAGNEPTTASRSPSHGTTRPSADGGRLNGADVLVSIKRSSLALAKHAGIADALARSAWRRRRLLILCHHGISLHDEHQWNPRLYVSPATFERRLEILRRNECDVLRLGEALDRLERGSLPDRAVVLTFDDGYYDFLARAYPLLERFRYPATVYLTTQRCEHNFPVVRLLASYVLWKCRDRVLDGRGLPGLSGRYRLDTEEERARIVAAFDRGLRERGLRPRGKDAEARRLVERLGLDYQRLFDGRVLRLMKPDEVSRTAGPLVDFQLHTHRHSAPEDTGALARDIRINRERIEAMTSRPAMHFCYPSGVHRPSYLPCLKSLGIVSATTCDPGLASIDSHRLLLPRFVDTELVSDLEFEAWVQGTASWLPRRTRRTHATAS